MIRNFRNIAFEVKFSEKFEGKGHDVRCWCAPKAKILNAASTFFDNILHNILRFAVKVFCIVQS